MISVYKARLLRVLPQISSVRALAGAQARQPAKMLRIASCASCVMFSGGFDPKTPPEERLPGLVMSVDISSPQDIGHERSVQFLVLNLDVQVLHISYEVVCPSKISLARSIVSASSADLSGRSRTMRGKRNAYPLSCRSDSIMLLNATSSTICGSTTRRNP